MSMTNENIVTTILYAVAMSCIASGLSGIVAAGDDSRMVASGVAWMFFCSLYVFGDLLMSKGGGVSACGDRCKFQLFLNLIAWVSFAVHGLFLGANGKDAILVISSCFGLVAATVSVLITNHTNLPKNGKAILIVENISFLLFSILVEVGSVSEALKHVLTSWWFVAELVVFGVLLVVHLWFLGKVDSKKLLQRFKKLINRR